MVREGVTVAKEGWRPKAEGLTVRCYVDSDWAGSTTKRKSTSGGFISVSGVPVCSWSRTQNVIAQSSMEAEFMSVVTGLSEGLGVCSLSSDFGFCASLIVLSDSSAGHQACLRVGVGKVRHLDVR